MAKLNNGGKLGDLVKSGYRVVYETTESIDRLEGERQGLPYFLQAADITTPFINAESMGCVATSDWYRYPKGRISPGELLIEVKGRAEKIALVPEDFPRNTLVTGTCFKLSTFERVDQYFLAAYLTCRHGQILKDRLKTNLLVSYLAKDDLYGLPVPSVSMRLKERIRNVFDICFSEHGKGHAFLKNAEMGLIQALSLENLQAPEPLSYVRHSSEAFAAGRLDAEYFKPRVLDLLSSLGRDGRTLRDVAPVRHEAFESSNAGKHFRYIEIGDIRNDGSVEANELATEDAPSRATQHVRSGDVLTSTVRPIRRLSAVVSAEQDGAVCSSGFVVLNPSSISASTLMTYLRLPLVCELMDLHTSASLYPAISEKDLMALPVPLISEAVQQSVDASVGASRRAKQRATQLLDAAKRGVEIAIEDSEAAAIAYLKEFM